MPEPITPTDLNPTDLDGLLALHAQTTQGPWAVLHETHQDTKIVQQGRGVFGLIAEASTAPDDYGRANAAFIAAAHRLLPGLASELADARKQIAGHQPPASA